MKEAKKNKPLSIYDELALLIEKSQALLDSSAPTLSEWEEYHDGRNELFNRLATLPTLFPDGEESASELQDLVAQMFEKDRLLLQKIEHHLSNLRQEIAASSEKRRVSEAYANHVGNTRALLRGRY